MPTLSPAVELTGRVTSSFYGFEQLDETHWRSYVQLNSNATLWRGGNSRSFSLRNNLRWKGDLAANEPETPQTYVRTLYLNLSGYPSGSTILAGRQFVYNTLGSSLIDGVRMKGRILESLRFDIFGGAAVLHETPEEISALSDHAVVGSRLKYSRSRSFTVGLAWLWQKSHGTLSRHRVGIDLACEYRRTELYSRISYDLINLTVADLLARLTARPQGWYVSTEFHWRRPSVGGNTVFSMIDADAYAGIRVEATRNLWRQIRALGQFHVEGFEGSDSWRTVVGLKVRQFMIAWHHRDGHGGESEGFQGRAYVPLNPTLAVHAEAFLSRYLIQPATPEKIDAYSSSFGLEWRPGKAVRVRLEGQYLKNAVNNSDSRIFVQLTKGFAAGTAGSGK
jgi:hypothetical protein